MPAEASVRLSAFESRWLAEALRLREQAVGPLDDRAETAAARGAGGDVEARILHRARRLGEREGLAGTIAAWGARARLALAAASAVALATGYGAALAVLGDGARTVNVVWALGALLGVHLLSLVLWFAGFAFGRRRRASEASGGLGRLWLRLVSRLSTGPAAAQVAQALIGLVARARLLPWWLGAVTHGLWLAALAGALAGLLVTLSARRYGFVWETTILPADAFVQFVQTIGAWPAQLGFAVPDVDAVRRSGAAVAPDDEVRRVWSSWLVGSVVAYGLAPRAALWLLCLGVWRIGRARLRLDPALPGYALLAARLAPASERLGVLDADPGAEPMPRFAAPHAVESSRGVAVGLELGAPSRWPPPLPAGVLDGGVLDNRDERQRAITMLQADPPARLLVVCDAGQSPDRGSLALIAELSRHAGECRVLLRREARPDERDHRSHWREGLAAIGAPSAQLFEDDAPAYRWLGGPATEPRHG